MAREGDYFTRLVDPDRLREYLAAELGSVDDDAYAVDHHQEGHSNETLFVRWGERDLVIRRPPPGETASSAHDVLREYRVMDALQATDVPLAPTILACEDHDVLGSDFYVMERVEGDVLRDSEPERFVVPEHREGIGTQLVDTLSTIHAVDPDSVGLGEFGYPDGFTERQVRRWSEQLTWAFSRTTEEREVPVLYDVMSWLTDNVPEEYPHTLVHGDYKLDNVMYAPGTPPKINAVFDWELSTLGDPRTDVGWMLSYWRDADDPEPEVPDLTTTFMEHPEYPTRRELVSRWEDATGFEYEHDRFYRALAVYKLAALGEMFFRRYLEGNSDDDLYPQMETQVPALGERAMRIVEGDEPL
ncbi:phosphotransferase family protein [Haloprofundus halobius]|uniref:phosphotransferase family protein n=1 Tax=Haloprofundus halobius TaxID=2876194 RepID=UPI001CCBEFB6|nr:phosphotransferase family protein [Haloprofundus halobius]